MRMDGYLNENLCKVTKTVRCFEELSINQGYLPKIRLVNS
jgi:hypothetical protein